MANQKVEFKLYRENPDTDHSPIILASSYNGNTYGIVNRYRKEQDNELGNYVAYAVNAALNAAISSRHDYGNSPVSLTIMDDLTGCYLAKITIPIK